MPFGDIILCHGISDTASCCSHGEIRVPAIAQCRKCVWCIHAHWQQVIRAAPNLLFIMNQPIQVRNSTKNKEHSRNIHMHTHKNSIKSTSIVLYKYTYYIRMHSSKMTVKTGPAETRPARPLAPATIDTWENSAKMWIFKVGVTGNQCTEYSCSYWEVESSFLTCIRSGHQRTQDENIPSYIGQWIQAYIWYPSLLPRHSLPPVPQTNIEGGKNWEQDCYVRCLQVWKCSAMVYANTPYNSLTLAPQCTAPP